MTNAIILQNKFSYLIQHSGVLTTENFFTEVHCTLYEVHSRKYTSTGCVHTCIVLLPSPITPWPSLNFLVLVIIKNRMH